MRKLFSSGDFKKWLCLSLRVGYLCDSVCVRSESMLEAVFFPWVSICGGKVQEFGFGKGRSVDVKGFCFGLPNSCVPSK